MSEDNIKVLRDKIDEIDSKLLDLLNARVKNAVEIGHIKSREGKEFYVPSRERAVLEKIQKANKGPFPNSSLKIIMREIMSASLSLEKPLNVSYLGPEATFTHLASMEHFGSSSNFVSKKRIADVFDDVERGRSDYGVVPIENSNEGMVTHTMDRFIDSNVLICGEILLSVSHCLMSKNGTMEGIKKIYSHAQPIGQCRNWLAANATDIPLVEVASTALAAQISSEDETVAAIASEHASVIYDLRPIERKIEDNPRNITRFLVIGQNMPDPTGDDKTSILFSVKDEVGILFKMLEPFSKLNVNLTKIESRPLKKKAWEYIFFLDMEGHREDNNVKEAMKALEEKSVFFKILGSYPRMRLD